MTIRSPESIELRNNDGLIDGDNPLPVTTSSLTLQLDEAGSGITYIGDAIVGSITSSSVWRIKRLDESGDPELIIKWADGDANFDNVWNDRASLSYL